MATLREMGRRIKSVNLLGNIPKFILAEKEYALDLNKNQLQQGKTSDGDSGVNLRGYKSFEYATYKNSINSQPDFGIPDLKLSGDFYRGFKLEADIRTFTIYSDDSKSTELENKYTIMIFGLNGKNKQRFAQRVYDNQMLPFVKKQLFKR